MRKVIGFSIAAIPFVVLFIAMADIGIKGVLIVIVDVALATLCIAGGLAIAWRGDE